MNKIYTEKAPAAIGPYSQGMKLGNLVFTSGQIPVDPATGAAAGDTIATQAEQSCKNVGAVLEAACVAVKDLPKGVLCEVEAIAFVKEG